MTYAQPYPLRPIRGPPLQNSLRTTQSYSFKYGCKLKQIMRNIHYVSDKYKQIFSMVKKISTKKHESLDDVRRSRVLCQKELAMELGIRWRTILDKCVRKLKLDGASEFDSLVWAFLNKNDMGLKNRCLQTSTKQVDDQAIISFFDNFFKN